MSSARKALDLFTIPVGGPNRVDWIANELLRLAAEAGSLSLRLVGSESATAWAMEAEDSSAVVSSGEAAALRLFRTVLARLASMAVAETGAEFAPYGARLRFRRNGSFGPAEIDVVFENSTSAQHVELTAVVPPIAATPMALSDKPDHSKIAP